MHHVFNKFKICRNIIDATWFWITPVSGNFGKIFENWSMHHVSESYFKHYFVLFLNFLQNCSQFLIADILVWQFWKSFRKLIDAPRCQRIPSSIFFFQISLKFSMHHVFYWSLALSENQKKFYLAVQAIFWKFVDAPCLRALPKT